MLKLFTGANPVKCFCASLLAMKTVSNYITQKYSFGARLEPKVVQEDKISISLLHSYRNKKPFHKHVLKETIQYLLL